MSDLDAGGFNTIDLDISSVLQRLLATEFMIAVIEYPLDDIDAALKLVRSGRAFRSARRVFHTFAGARGRGFRGKRNRLEIIAYRCIHIFGDVTPASGVFITLL